MIADIKKNAEQKMKKTIEALKTDLGKVRTGRAHTGILDHVMVDYYGNPTPLPQVANVTLVDGRTIGVSPYEKKMAQAIEKATVTKVDGIETKIVFLVDSPDQPKESIMAAIIPMDEQSSLFIKYKGDAATAETEKANFIKFVESVRWK